MLILFNLSYNLFNTMSLDMISRLEYILIFIVSELFLARIHSSQIFLGLRCNLRVRFRLCLTHCVINQYSVNIF